MVGLSTYLCESGGRQGKEGEEMHCVVDLLWGGVVREWLIGFLVWYV